MERSLDWTMSRKRMEIQEALGKPMKVRSAETVQITIQVHVQLTYFCISYRFAENYASSSPMLRRARLGRRHRQRTWKAVLVSPHGRFVSKDECLT